MVGIRCGGRLVVGGLISFGRVVKMVFIIRLVNMLRVVLLRCGILFSSVRLVVRLLVMCWCRLVMVWWIGNELLYCLWVRKRNCEWLVLIVLRKMCIEVLISLFSLNLLWCIVCRVVWKVLLILVISVRLSWFMLLKCW